MAADKAKELGIKPIAKMVSFGVAGCDATMMGLWTNLCCTKGSETCRQDN